MEKILIIEDEKALRDNLNILLTEEGYKVFQASNGLEGIKLIHEINPDLIISDIMMPGIDGYQVLEILSSDKYANNIPFIFLTAKAEMENLRFGMQLGADDYLVKPFKAADLLAAIKVRLQKHKNYVKMLQNLKTTHKEPDKESNDTLMLKLNDKIELINKKDIICVEALGESSKVYLTKGRKVIAGKLLKQWESVLPSTEFVRIHRSTLINLKYLDRIERWFQRSLKVYLKETEKTFIVSKRYASKLKEYLSI